MTLDNVLAQPTRARLFARLSRLDRPAGTDELAAELALHPSGVRVHLERLKDAGLVARDRVPQLRGRPRDSWSVAPDAVPGGEPPDAYLQLARWLALSTPAREAVRANQPVVCALHRGLTRGLLDELQPSARLTRFVPEDPGEAGCLIEVEGLERAGAADGRRAMQDR
jgi:DNA-binding transcriptional ArsR family regulator